MSVRKTTYNQREADIVESRGGSTSSKAVARFTIEVVHEEYHKWTL
ncbi:MAG TPA: hypothetical protein VE077_04030 [Candidatus Methylomirabilis sp.]|nr:hypothetical protein [Candidatus Methylomirabilis sp.]